MKIFITRKYSILSGLALLTFAGCMEKRDPNPEIPSLDYAVNLKAQLGSQVVNSPTAAVAMSADNIIRMREESAAKAGMHFVNAQGTGNNAVVGEQDFVTNNNNGFETIESSFQNSRDYNGPLSLGDPGVTASLWRESRGTNDIFRDQRAWQPMDLITIVVAEKSKGSKEADTDVKSESTVEAAISQFFAQDDELANSAPDGEILPDNLINAKTTNEFKGEGTTTRKGDLTASISAMVAEVLPSGILRIEGKKIISVNNEEQVMVISGLARPRDINSNNEIPSAKIANMRIDYYGHGIVGEAQYGGWFGRLMHVLWPF